MTTPRACKKALIESLQNDIDYTFDSWDPSIEVWRAGEGHERELPYIAVDFIETSEKRFPSLGDIVGVLDDGRFEYAYCELELVNISLYAAKDHNSGAVRGRDFAYESMVKIRKRILAYWNNILSDYNASIDRKIPMAIRDLTRFTEDVATRIHEFDMDVFLRTDVRWYHDLVPGQDYDERAEKAYIIMNNKNNIRIDTS